MDFLRGTNISGGGGLFDRLFCEESIRKDARDEESSQVVGALSWVEAAAAVAANVPSSLGDDHLDRTTADDDDNCWLLEKLVELASPWLIDSLLLYFTFVALLCTLLLVTRLPFLAQEMGLNDGLE